MAGILDDYKESIKKIHGYSEELARNIAVLADSMVEYYGEGYRDLIYDAIASCNYIVEKAKKSGKMQTVEDILKSVNSLDVVEGLPIKRDLKSATVAYSAKPIITSKNGKFIVADVIKTIAISSRFSWENPDSIDSIAIETERLINNYIGGFEIKGNELLIREGLSTRVETLSESDGKVIRSFKSENNYGLEEGITLYNAESITRGDYYSDYDASGLDENRLTAGVLIDGAGLKDVIMNARVTKDIEELESILGENYSKLGTALDQIHSLSIKRSQALGDSNQLADLTKSIDEVFEHTVAPITNSIMADFSLSEVGQNVLR